MRRTIVGSMLILLSCAGLAGCRQEQQETVDGGTIYQAPQAERKEIESQNIEAFSGMFAMEQEVEEDDFFIGQLFELEAALQNGTVTGSYQEYVMYGDVVERAFEAEPAFMKQLQELVLKYDLVQYAEHYRHTEGLPEFYGDELYIRYTSGETLYAYDNTDHILPTEAVTEIVNLFRDSDVYR